MSFFDRLKSKKNGMENKVENDKAEIMEEGASLVAEAWKEGKAEILRPILSDEFQYTSVAVASPMNGAETYLHYLAGKFETFRKNGIEYNPVVTDGDTPDSKIVILNSNSNPDDQNPAVIVIQFRDSRISAMQMRPKIMFSMQDLNEEGKADLIVEKACDAIHNWIQTEASRLGFEEKDFCWLQYNPILEAPAFQHMCFRLGKSVFSVVIYLYGQYHTDEKDIMEMLPNVQIENQLRECMENDLIACSVYLDINALAVPTLCYTQKDERVDLKKDALSGSGIMSKWEINAMAINIVIQYLLQSSVDSLYYTNVLTFYPQIYYYKDQYPYFAYVGGHPSGVEATPIELNLVENACASGYIGKFADVGMSFLEGNNGDFNDKVLPRCNSIISNFKELIPIEDAISIYGIKS